APTRSPRRSLRTTLPLPGPPGTARCLVSVLVSFTPVRHSSPAVAGPAFWQVTDGGEPVRTPASSVGKRVGGNPSRVRISHPPPPLTRQYTSPSLLSASACKAV